MSLRSKRCYNPPHPKEEEVIICCVKSSIPVWACLLVSEVNMYQNIIHASCFLVFPVSHLHVVSKSRLGIFCWACWESFLFTFHSCLCCFPVPGIWYITLPVAILGKIATGFEYFIGKKCRIMMEKALDSGARMALPLASCVVWVVMFAV